MLIELIGAAAVLITALTPMVVALSKFNSRLKTLERENGELRTEVKELTAALKTERRERKELQGELTASLRAAANQQHSW